MSRYEHIIKINHIGFVKNSQKRFVLTENPHNEEAFSLQYIYHTEYKTVYTSTLKKVTEDDGRIYWVGDFSDIDSPGDYVIKVGDILSRTFVIYDKAYDICWRTLLSYFTYQKCGSEIENNI